jgi:hypothetical protein
MEYGVLLSTLNTFALADMMRTGRPQLSILTSPTIRPKIAADLEQAQPHGDPSSRDFESHNGILPQSKFGRPELSKETSAKALWTGRDKVIRPYLELLSRS